MQQVHADASNFAEGVTKEEAYQQVLDQAEGLFYEQRNWVWPLLVPRPVLDFSPALSCETAMADPLLLLSRYGELQFPTVPFPLSTEKGANLSV